MNSNPLSIGNTPLRPDKFGSEALKGLAEAAAESAVRKAKKGSLEALESWQESKSITPEDFATISGFAAESAQKYGALKSEWWKLFKAGEAGKPILDIEAKMAREGNLVSRHGKLVGELRESTARLAVQALSGSVMGAAGIAAAYVAYSNGPVWTPTADRNTGALLESVKSLEGGTSRMINEGNEATQVHREELWKQMNTTLDTAIENGKAGKPQELDLQYYELTSPEMVGKIAAAAKAGNPTRVNLDAGRLSFPSKDVEGEDYFSLDATPDKLRTIIQLASVPDADIAVSLFPQKKLINSPGNLMHRKIMRYGEDVLISGMNANLGSGENVDSGYVVRGPAGKALVENFKRDVENSKGATLDDIWGAEHIQKFQDTNLRMGKRGFTALFDTLGGHSAAGTILPSPQNLAELEALATEAGSELRELVKVPKADYEKVMTKVAERTAEVELSAKGKKLMRALIEKAISVTNTPENLERLDKIELPSGDKVGKTRVDIGDLPVERETLAIEAIAKAEKFIYLPGFVVTKAISAAIVERRDQLKADGKELDVRVIADSGLYPHGGTPNSIGVKHLEDNGIQPRWSRLERTSWHDRKIHAKQLITDKGEITGSTNFSNKGMADNWETSAYVHFDTDDSKAMKQRDATKSQFEGLWETSYELNSHDHAAFLNRARGVKPSELTIDEDRDRSVRHVLRLLINFEKGTGKLFQGLVETVPEIATQRTALIAEGYSEGDATLLAAKANLGPEKYSALIEALPAAQQLATLRQEVDDWKAGKGAPPIRSGELEDGVKGVKAAATVPASTTLAGISGGGGAPLFRKADFYVGGLRGSEVSYIDSFV